MPRQFIFDPTKVLPGDSLFVIRTSESISPVSGAVGFGILARPYILIIESVVKRFTCVGARSADTAPMVRTWTFTMIPSVKLSDGITEFTLTDKSIAFTTFLGAAKWIEEQGLSLALTAADHDDRQEVYRRKLKLKD